MAIYKRFFAQIYDPVVYDFEKSLFEKRRALLSNLKGTVLGVGEGTGINFKFYPKEIDVIAVEPSKAMLKKARKKNKYGNISFHNLGINDPELDNIIQERSIDAIVCTLVLCTISDPEKALLNFKKWLKPNGKLIVLEHIHATKQINKAFQNFVNPVWKVFADGCNLNRNTDLLINEAGFVPVKEEYFKRALRFYSGIFELKESN